jgi:hypothetical protein
MLAMHKLGRGRLWSYAAFEREVIEATREHASGMPAVVDYAARADGATGWTPLPQRLAPRCPATPSAWPHACRRAHARVSAWRLR